MHPKSTLCSVSVYLLFYLFLFFTITIADHLNNYIKKKLGCFSPYCLPINYLEVIISFPNLSFVENGPRPKKWKRAAGANTLGPVFVIKKKKIKNIVFNYYNK